MEIIEYLVLTEKDVGDGWETYLEWLKAGSHNTHNQMQHAYGG